MKVKIMDAIFREYDIRGKFGVDLTEEVSEAIGRGYALYLKESIKKDCPKVTVGRDVRLSSNAIRDSLIKGLVESGICCVDLGECPTPLQYFSLHTLDVDGGIMITGSHNPPEYNGFKVSIGKETLYGNEIQKLKDIIKETSQSEKTTARRGNVESVDIISKYINYHTEKFSPPKLKKPLKIVVDAGNGTGGLVAPKLLSIIGCDVKELFCKPDGRFPNHHPDPTVEKNIKTLREEVKKSGADFGVGYDGDADRIGIVDEKGGVVWGDQLMVIFARDIINRLPTAVIVGEVKCTSTMYDEIEKIGGRAVMWKTGHSLIKAKMKELDAALAGEMSGHIFFADRYFGFDDAIYATLRLVEILSKKREKTPDFPFSRLLEGLPKTFSTPEIRVDCPDNEKFRMIERLKDTMKDSKGLKIKDIISIDGLRIVFNNGWALVRASNTQPVVVLRFEAQNEVLLEEIKKFTSDSIKKVYPGFKMP